MRTWKYFVLFSSYEKFFVSHELLSQTPVKRKELPQCNILHTYAYRTFEQRNCDQYREYAMRGFRKNVFTCWSLKKKISCFQNNLSSSSNPIVDKHTLQHNHSKWNIFQIWMYVNWLIQPPIKWSHIMDQFYII